MRQSKTKWNSTEAMDEEKRDREQGTDVEKGDTSRLAGSTMISLGHHREGVDVECKKDEKTDPEGFSDIGVNVASAAFVLAGVALSTIPAALL
jgi:hypothetical protein